MLSPISGIVAFTMGADDSYIARIDNSSGIETYIFVGGSTQNVNIDFIMNKYYFVYAEFNKGVGSFKFNMNWNCSGVSTSIPNSNIYLQTLVGSSPYNINVFESICGDGFKTGYETWDDKNTIEWDGWSSDCQTESGWSWSGGSISTSDVWVEVWGDGKRFNSNSTYWDDGNTLDGDGCSSTWKVESGWTLSGGGNTNADICKEICGDGRRFNVRSAYWDDGNVINGDGWDSSCSVEYGYKWSGGSSNSKDIWVINRDVTYSEYISSLLTQILIAISFLTIITNSLINLSSPIGAFILFNQFQLLFLIIVSGTFLSNGVFYLIVGMNIVLFNFEFIKIEHIENIKNFFWCATYWIWISLYFAAANSNMVVVTKRSRERCSRVLTLV